MAESLQQRATGHGSAMESVHEVHIAPMRETEAEMVATLVRDIVEPLPYYNQLARQSEIAKYSADHLLASMQEDPHSVAVARVDDQVVGFSISRFDDFLIWISWIGVHPEARRSGVARALLADIERTAVLRGAHKVWADSRTDNSVMAVLFPQAGYERIATIARHWYQQDFHLWQKLIEDSNASTSR